MPLNQPVNPGTVVWTGENHGILLQQPADTWSVLALYFRLFYTPEGSGTALLFYERPDLAESLPTACNVMISDNEQMARYLMASFIGKLTNSPFAASPAFGAVQYLPLTANRREGDPNRRFSEIVCAEGIEIELTWDGLGTPTALELPKELTGPKQNDLFTLLIESREPTVRLNGRELPGTPAARVQAGIETTTAFLYFSETWIAPAGG